MIEKLITQFGEELCPGPSSNPTLYITDAKQCRAHAITVGGKNIFDAMRAAYPDAKTDTAALSDTLIIASLATQEIKKAADFAGVVTVYHNRYLNIETQGSADVGYLLGSDPSAEYARDTITPPANGKWWAAPADASKIAVTNPYNTRTQAGMPPGAIVEPVYYRHQRRSRSRKVALLLLRLRQVRQVLLCDEPGRLQQQRQTEAGYRQLLG